jgi:hypothetical protein
MVCGMAGNRNIDMGIFLNKVPQVRKQDIFAQRGADANRQVPNA